MRTPKQYNITPAKGQALLNFQDRRLPERMDVFETEVTEEVRTAKAKDQSFFDNETELNSDFRNLLLQGDCLSACAYLKSRNIKVDLVYIDPPFASGANYVKKIYLRNGGKPAPGSSQQRSEIETDDNTIGEEVMYGDIWQKEDYLNWLYERLLIIKDVMSEEASIYVHLDSTIGHYAKILMDEVFGEINFINEIIWYYEDKFATGGKSLDKNHDTILFYSKGEEYTFHSIIIAKDRSTTRALRKKVDGKTVNVLDERGNKIYVEYSEKKEDDVWDLGRTISNSQYQNYATQKPEALLERIIKASSDEGMIIADFFSGSGTTAKVANDLRRKFIACDIGINALQTTRDRLVKAGADFDVLKIRDGLRLFRNPAQTTAKIFSLIDGFKSSADLDLNNFWNGGIAQANGSYTPVKFSGIHDRLTRELLDVYLEEIYKLEDTTNQANEIMLIYAHKDMDLAQEYLDKQLNKTGKTELKVRLIALDSLLGEKKDTFFTPDSADIQKRKQGNKHLVEIRKYYSPYLKNKIDEYNAKKTKKSATGQDSSKAATISDNGLELIESVQFDTTLKKVWKSNPALEDKAGVKEKIKGVYTLDTDEFKIKIRNIAGDEIVIDHHP